MKRSSLPPIRSLGLTQPLRPWTTEGWRGGETTATSPDLLLAGGTGDGHASAEGIATKPDPPPVNILHRGDIGKGSPDILLPGGLIRQLPLAPTHPAEVEPQGQYRLLSQRLANGKDNIVRHRAAIEGVGMANHHRGKGALPLGRVANPLQRKLAAGEGDLPHLFSPLWPHSPCQALSRLSISFS